MNIFVVNAYDDRKDKYAKDKRYQLYDAVWWENVTEEQTDALYFRHNAKMPLRKKITACSLSHKNLLKKIITDNLKDTVILEDDALINDWERLEELKDVKEFCYLGGDITSPFLKDMKKFKEEGEKDNIRYCCQKGINHIDKDVFKIGQTCGYYIPNASVAQDILSNIPHGQKERAIDNEYIALQKKGKINLFLYPAIAVLNVDEAKKGFTYSGYKLYDNQEFY